MARPFCLRVFACPFGAACGSLSRTNHPMHVVIPAETKGGINIHMLHVFPLKVKIFLPIKPFYPRADARG